jgi:ABC-2 type transport system permease protein
MKRFRFCNKRILSYFSGQTLDVHPLGMPIAQIMLFGFAITNEINNVNIAILDKSKDTETEIIINKISASQYFHIKQTISTESEIESIFKKGR